MLRLPFFPYRLLNFEVTIVFASASFVNIFRVSIFPEASVLALLLPTAGLQMPITASQNMTGLLGMRSAVNSS